MQVVPLHCLVELIWVFALGFLSQHLWSATVAHRLLGYPKAAGMMEIQGMAPLQHKSSIWQWLMHAGWRRRPHTCSTLSCFW